MQQRWLFGWAGQVLQAEGTLFKLIFLWSSNATGVTERVMQPLKQYLHMKLRFGASDTL